MTVLPGLDSGAESVRALCVTWTRQKIVSNAAPCLHPNLHHNGPCSGITGECPRQRAFFFQYTAG